MSEETVTPPQSVDRYGAQLFSWYIPEYEQHDRGVWWYILFCGTLLGLITYAVMDGNFLFALIILLFGFIIFTHHRSDPMNVEFTIYERGVRVGDRSFFFRELESFAIIYEPPIVKKLYITPRAQMVRKEIGIPLLDNDPLEIRSMLLTVVKEDLERERESSSEILSRVFKL